MRHAPLPILLLATVCSCGRAPSQLADASAVDTPRPDALPPHHSFVDLAVEGCFACAIRDDGRVICWGNRTGFDKQIPEGRFKTIDFNGWLGCAIRESGALACWGSAATPPGGRFSSVRVSSTASCALRSDGRALCWQYQGAAPLEIPGPLLTNLSLKDQHACGMTEEQTAHCWRVPDSTYLPAEDPPDHLLSISAGYEYRSCGLRQSDSQVFCWPYRVDFANNPWLAAPLPGQQLKALDVDHDYACGLTPEGYIRCWPRDQQASPPNLPLDNLPSRGGYINVRTGSSYACALHEDGMVDCWGSGSCSAYKAADPNSLP